MKPNYKSEVKRRVDKLNTGDLKSDDQKDSA